MRVHIDRGGTFTDIVRVIDGVATIAKVPSDTAVVGDLALAPDVTFGTTVATNALLERHGVATLLIVSPGFEDLVYLRDMARPALFDPDAEHPPTLATAVTSDPSCDLSAYAAIAIVLLGGGDDPRAELALEAAIAARSDAYIALGHRVSRDKGYLARIETTLVDAAITPLLLRSMQRDRIPPHWLAMRSDGSLVAAAALRAHEAVLSGPAGGVLATLATAQAAGFTHAVGLDMGGTSTDVCIVDVAAGLPLREGDIEVAGVRLRRAMLEIETIAAGGGSILDSDVTGLSVGPQSAGADPGPQCYGRGGPPTITDAALALGLIDPGHFPFALHPERVVLPGPPEAFIAIARESMAQAVRRVAMARGVDLRGHALVAYGGAGGQHAAAVAALLGITTVLVHPAASVLCAFGQSLARRSETRRAALWGPLVALAASLPGRFTTLANELPVGPEWHAPAFAIALGHSGTDHPIELAWTPTTDLAAAFDAAYTTRYGFARAGTLDVFGLVARVHAHALAPSTMAPFPLAHEVDGPTVLHAPTTSVEVPRGWRARVEHGLLRLDQIAHGAPAHASGRRELWHNRLTAIAVEAGVVLARLARSVSIKERLDFSCAIFDAAGQLITNAPHIPVHLGAMGDTVRDVAGAITPDARAGDAWLSNDPAAGGSHLPDLTVVTLVVHDGQRFFVASRGHHVDVGGLTPGSIPVASRTLDDEGVRFSRVPLVTTGVVADLRALVTGSRQPAVVAADLEAQLAANAHMARRLCELPADHLTTAMADLFAHARQATEALIARLPKTPLSARDDIDGVPLVVTIHVGDRLVIDFTGTGGPHPGNLNAPRAVVRAAVLYALRIATAATHLPLNDGTLAAVEIITPAPSIVAPQSDAAIVGGNVETSQRIVDLILVALDLRAASAGTMNNLVLGRAPDDPDHDEWAFYETLGAGFGATANSPGRSARQLHMTNTRATDPEVLAARLPLRVTYFGVRRGSGGVGRNAGGDGLVRELVVTRPALASLLAAWRPDGAPGLHGGGAGAPGRAFLIADGVATPWDGRTTRLAPGMRVRVETPGGGAWGTPEA